MNTALRISGFQLKNKLQEEIRSGAPGGNRFAPLTVLGQKWHYSRRTSGALNRLAYGVRYHVPNTQTPVLMVGYVGPVNKREHAEMVRSGLKLSSSGGFRGISSSQMTSQSWRRLAYKHQKGFSRKVTDPQRASLLRRGHSVSDPQLKRLFVGTALHTQEFHTPSRPIIEPFWQQYEKSTIAEIRKNWSRKMRGERI